MSEPIIRIENVSKVFRLGQFGAGSLREDLENWFRRRKEGEKRRRATKDFWALRDVSLDVQEGEIVGLIGRNGAGKSTLLKILSRITEPTRGRIVMNGRVGSLLEVGTGFNPQLTGRENIYLNGAILGMRRREVARKFDEIVAFSDCEEFVDTPVKRYSSGMRVRLAFAVAAHLEPEILIVDEVLAVGDASFQEKCIGKMDDVAKEGRTILFVSHNMGMIRQLCQRVIVMANGRVTGDEDTETGVNRYLSQYENNDIDPFSIDHPLRRYKRGPRFTGIRVLAEDGKPAKAFVSGETVHFDVSFDPMGEQINDVRMTFWNSMGTGAAQLWVSLVEKTPRFVAPGVVRFTVPNLPLPPNRYRVALLCYDGSKRTDLIPNACFFLVTAGSIFPTGRCPPAQKATVQIPFTVAQLDDSESALVAAATAS